MNNEAIFEKIRVLSRDLHQKVVEHRRYFHSHPELSMEEFETSKTIASILEDLGYENVRVGTAGKPTGVVADLNSDKPGKCIALRADMDALPIQEETGLPYASQNDGVMHACGHDSHIAILLGVAELIMKTKDIFPWKVRLIFQPSEESGSTPGARAMVADGVLDGVDAITGLHVWMNVPSGKIGYRRGPLMASADKWEVRLQGKGGHGAVPQTAVDPTLAAGHLITMLQSIVSRETDPLESIVVSVGKMEAGNAFNIIPDSAYLLGTTRTFNPELRDELPGRMKRIAEHVAEATRCSAEFTYHNNLPPTVNDAEFTEKGAIAASRVLGEEKVVEIPPTMGAEDFSFYLEKIPGSYFFLGIGNESKGITAPHHHPRFQVDEDVLSDGVALISAVAANYLSEEN
jgi:amidohydrolase